MNSTTSSSYGHTFQPEEIERLATAYALAYGELCASILVRRPGIENSMAKQILAQRIIAAATTYGTHDIDRLRQQALRSWWRLKSTPFKAYTSFFGLDDLDAMTAAYERVWSQLRAGTTVLASAEHVRLKRQITQVILAAACTGERQSEPLTDAALRAVSRTKPRLEASLTFEGDSNPYITDDQVCVGESRVGC